MSSVATAVVVDDRVRGGRKSATCHATHAGEDCDSKEKLIHDVDDLCCIVLVEMNSVFDYLVILVRKACLSSFVFGSRGGNVEYMNICVSSCPARCRARVTAVIGKPTHSVSGPCCILLTN